MAEITSKLPGVGTTIFTVMSRLAAEHGAINLSQGFPDFPPPQDLLERVGRHLREGSQQYAPMEGLPALREAIARKSLALYGAPVDPATEITVTSGATEALFCAIQAVIGPGDELLVLDPAYDSYEPAAVLAGGSAVHVPMSPPSFAVDWGRVSRSIGPRTRAIAINSPHNPTGSVFGVDDLRALEELVARTGIFVIADEVYEHIVFDGLRHEGILRYPALRERSFVVSSFGKTFHATGWKVGYCIAPAALMLEFRRIHQFVQFCVVTPIQHALAEHLDADPGHCLELGAFYQQKRDHFAALLAGSRFRLLRSRGTYFQLADYSAIADEPDVNFARRLTTDAGVAAIPVSVFCREPGEARLVRFCFAKDAATLERAGERLSRL